MCAQVIDYRIVNMSRVCHDTRILDSYRTAEKGETRHRVLSFLRDSSGRVTDGWRRKSLQTAWIVGEARG
jgi:hypothetical protein